MKANFDKTSKKKSTREEHSHMEKGSYEDIIKHRDEMRPRLEAEIQDALDGWHGQAFALFVVAEDENGSPTGMRQIMSGVGRPESQVLLAKNLRESGADLLKNILKSAEGDPETLIELMRVIAKIMSAEEI